MERRRRSREEAQCLEAFNTDGSSLHVSNRKICPNDPIHLCLPLAVSTHAANHHEVTLVQLSFDFYMIEAKPENLVGDRAPAVVILLKQF